ncbi:MAG: DnaJ C-terminal domain-containing protein [Phycisphaerales bacterium]
MASRDYYEILGVSRTASADEIRSAHRRLVKKLHPDVNKAPDAQKRFSEVQQAFDVLSDPQKRKQYDTFGEVGAAAAGAAAGQAHGHSRGGARSGGFEQVNVGDFSEIFEDLFGGRGAAGGRSPFGRAGTTGRTARESAGADVAQAIDIDFTTAALGGTRSLSLTLPDGSTHSFDVRIPPGIDTGGRLRVRGKGAPGRRDGAAGDLVLEVRVAPHPWFRREGRDLLLDVPITIAEAALGATIEVPLLRGSVTLKVPPGTSSGQKLRVRGKGVAGGPGAGGASSEPGDFHAVIQIVAPRELSSEDATALRAMSARLGDPREGMPWASE